MSRGPDSPYDKFIPIPKSPEITEWEWYYIGRCFLNDRLSFTVRIDHHEALEHDGKPIREESFQVSCYTENDQAGHISGTYLGVPSDARQFKTMQEAVNSVTGHINTYQLGSSKPRKVQTAILERLKAIRMEGQAVRIAELVHALDIATEALSKDWKALDRIAACFGISPEDLEEKPPQPQRSKRK